jgi:3-methyladenine DNA glycosylase/8-oxoguanine DNA glycosylase
MAVQELGQPVRGGRARAGSIGFDVRAALEHVRESDAALARVIDHVGAFRLDLELRKPASVFDALAEAIVYQQLTGKAAATIYGRVCDLFPRAPRGPTPERILRTSDEKLRGAGLSRAKALALRDLASRTKSGQVPTLAEIRDMDDAEIVEKLTAVRGIGRWTAEMLLIFSLGRPDVLPVDDYGIRKGFAKAFRRRELPGRKELEKRGERWRPYRTVASWYLWRVVEPARK